MLPTRSLQSPYPSFDTMPKPRKFAGTAREPYTSLKPRIKALKESTIRKKWKKLPTGTQVKVADLLRTVGRPALIHGNTERRNVETQVAVAELVSKYAGQETSFHKTLAAFAD